MKRNARPIPGHVARMVTVILERISAGDPPEVVCADYDFEWGHGPDLSLLVALVKLREAVRAHDDGIGSWESVARALKRAGGRRR